MLWPLCLSWAGWTQPSPSKRERSWEDGASVDSRLVSRGDPTNHPTPAILSGLEHHWRCEWVWSWLGLVLWEEGARKVFVPYPFEPFAPLSIQKLCKHVAPSFSG